jgi:hypothetical protein
MNDEFFTPEDQRLLDRLVDGELDEAERRALLLRLDQAPQGWRHCALAFLEAQAWRSETRAAVTEPVATLIRPAASQRSWAKPALYIPLAMAAGFVLTFVLLKNRDGREFAVIPAPDGTRVQVVDDTPSMSGQNLRLVVDGTVGERQKMVNVPLVDAQGMNEALFGAASQSLPADFVRLLEQSGHQVVRERRLVPVDLHDGRRVVVPMDQVEIRPVSNQGYQ